MNTKLANESLIVVKKVVMAPREEVYNAWIDPEVRKQWWKNSPEDICNLCQIDAQVGGSYRIGMSKGENEYFCVGEFTALDPPRLLSFSWSWEHSPEFAAGSEVTVELIEIEIENKAATEVVLTHDKLTLPIARSEHNKGWLGCLNSLGSLFVENDSSSCEQ